MGREIDVLSPAIKIALDGLKQKIETFSPGQYIDGKTGIQHLVRQSMLIYKRHKN